MGGCRGWAVRNFLLVAVAALTREVVASIQAGVDPDDPADDVTVLCHVSIGEDIALEPRCPDAYLEDVGPDRYPYEAVVSDLPAGETQHLVLRAVDEAGNEDANTTVLTATP